jgi:hypothetical protein
MRRKSIWLKKTISAAKNRKDVSEESWIFFIMLTKAILSDYTYESAGSAAYQPVSATIPIALLPPVTTLAALEGALLRRICPNFNFRFLL